MIKQIREGVIKKLKNKKPDDSNLWLHPEVLDMTIKDTAEKIFDELLTECIIKRKNSTLLYLDVLRYNKLKKEFEIE